MKAPHSPETVNGRVVSAVDWRGNRFRVGEQVMYCIGAGRGQMMAVGVVQQIKVETEHVHRWEECDADDPDARPSYKPTGFARLVLVPVDEIRVQVRTLKTSGRWDNEERTKPAWVNPMNITAIPTVETS